MEKIKLVQNAYFDGHNGGFLNYIDSDGKPSFYGLKNSWYRAEAVDEKQNNYTVYWSIYDFDAFHNGDEDCCNWLKPYMVIDKDGKNVADKISIEI